MTTHETQTTRRTSVRTAVRDYAMRLGLCERIGTIAALMRLECGSDQAAIDLGRAVVRAGAR